MFSIPSANLFVRCFESHDEARLNMPDEVKFVLCQSLQSLEGYLFLAVRIMDSEISEYCCYLLCQVCKRLPMSVQVCNFLD